MFGLFTSNEVVVGAAYVLVALAVYLLTRFLMSEQESRAAQDNLSESRDLKNSGGFVKAVRPIYSQYFVPMVRGKSFWNKYREEAGALIPTAGLKDEFTADEFVAFRLFLVFFAPVLLGFLKAGDFLSLEPWMILVSPVAGWFYPKFWIDGLIKARQKKILRAMPFIVDLLALSTEAGLDFIGAIGKVVEKSQPSPLVDEFSQLLKEIKVGASRQEGLREMSKRIGMREFNSFVAVLISADQMGASIGKILRQQSDQIRVTRILMAEKAGAAASQKIILPLVIFILPAVMLMIFGPFGISMIYPNGVPGQGTASNSDRTIAGESSSGP
ncbi:MAG: type II secretion system F family protein [Bdellovibrionales bacterium]|nr:type II secretion system F family protein [Bdellovibrionales bacterium]